MLHRLLRPAAHQHILINSLSCSAARSFSARATSSVLTPTRIGVARTQSSSTTSSFCPHHRFLSTSVSHRHAAATSSSSSTSSVNHNSPSSNQQQQRTHSHNSNNSSNGRSWSTRIGIVFFLSTACFTLYLGQWQVKRRVWKQELIARRTASLSAPPIDLREYLASRTNDAVIATTAAAPASSSSSSSPPTIADSTASDDLRRVTTRGRFHYARTMLVGPRSPPSADGSSTAGQGIGYFLVTPMELVNGTGTILVNRGWCSKEKLRDAKESEKESDVIEVIGVLRRGEDRPQFLTTDYDPLKSDSFIYLDLPVMSRLCQIQSPIINGTPVPPVLLDALEANNSSSTTTTRNRAMRRRHIDEYVVFSTTPMIHAVYATTWFTLSVALVALTWIRFKRKVRVPQSMGRHLTKNFRRPVRSIMTPDLCST